MRSDNRLSRVLHVLIHMHQHPGPMTSEALAAMLGTNAVVMRRTMAGLRDAGLVKSDKGHGGGSMLVRDLADVTLRDVYDALGSPPVFALGFAEDTPQCLVEQVVNESLADALADAEAALLARFGAISLKDLADKFQQRAANTGHRARHS
jgi:DNA-binding IscR family transcriptional regulator